MNEKSEKIRHIQPADYRAIYEVIRAAFWNLYRPGCEEHLIAERIFGSQDYLPALSFVIEREGEIVGCILYTKIKLLGDDGFNREAVSFGPVCILPRLHRQGLGRKLICHSLQAAKEAGYPGVVIAGARKHYECYGFVGAKKFGLRLPDGKYYHAFMALPLREGGLDNAAGVICFAGCMADATAQEIAEFDRDFPFLKKAVLPCQREFEEAASRIDDGEQG